jgi:septal ring factor EnvC (AmiA/AmiB activator)
MVPTSTNPADARAADNERLNDQFHTLLREAADKREGRARNEATEDAAASKRESANLLALARSQGRGQANRSTGIGTTSTFGSQAKS